MELFHLILFLSQSLHIFQIIGYLKVQSHGLYKNEHCHSENFSEWDTYVEESQKAT